MRIRKKTLALFCAIGTGFCGTGCVSARYKSWDRTTTEPDGTIIRERGRWATYADSSNSPTAAMNVLNQAGGSLMELLASLSGSALLAGGGGAVGAVGFTAYIARALARNRERAEAERRVREAADRAWDEAWASAVIRKPKSRT